MDHIDRKIRERLNNYNAPIADHIWLEVERSIVPEKREKGLVFFILGSLLILLSVITIYYSNNSQKNIVGEITKSENMSSSKDRLLNIANFTNPDELKESIKIPIQPLISKETQPKSNEALPLYSNDKFYQKHTSKEGAVERQIINTFLEEKTELDLSSITANENFDRRSSVSTGFVQKMRIKYIHNQAIKPKGPEFCPSIGKKASPPFSIDIYSSIDYPLSFRSAASNEPQQQYINQRNFTENSVVSFHAGIRVSQPVYKNISVRLGLEYAQINERFQLIDSGAIRVQTVIDSIFAPDGTLIDIATNTITESGIREINHYNHLKYYTIPVTVGIQKSLNKMKLFMHAGAQFTVLSSYKGKILSPQLSAVEINSDGTAELQPYRSNLGINLVGSLGLSSPLSEHWSLLVEPNFRYTLRSISRGTYPVNQKYLTLGISTGLRYNF